MRKRFACALVLFMLVFLCACKNQTDEGTKEAPNTQAANKGDSASLGLEFKDNGDGTCTLVGIGTYNEKELVISTADSHGNIITAIEESAFESCFSIERLIFDRAELIVDCYAFADCVGLKEIVVKDSSLTVKKEAFGSSGVEAVQINNSDVTIEEAAFNNFVLTRFEAEDSTVNIEEDAFTYGPIKELVLQNSDVNIEEGAFEYCEELTEFTVKGGTLKLGEKAFRGCPGLTEINLQCQVAARAKAFYNCENLTSVTFGDDPVKLGDEAFALCSQLKSVTLENTDLKLEQDVFAGCSEDMVIYMDGKEYNRNLEEIVPDTGKAFHADDLTITLTDEFKETEVEGIDFAFLSSNVGVVLIKEEFSKLLDFGMDPDKMTLAEYAKACISANDLGDLPVEEKNGMTYFIFEIDSFTYYSAVYRGTDAFWRCNIYTYTEDFDSMLSQFEQWAASVTIG